MIISGGAIGEAHQYARLYVAPIHTHLFVFVPKQVGLSFCRPLRDKRQLGAEHSLPGRSTRIRRRSCKPRCRCSSWQPLAWLNITLTYRYLCYEETNYSNVTVRCVLLNPNGAFSVWTNLRYHVTVIGSPN